MAWHQWGDAPIEVTICILATTLIQIRSLIRQTDFQGISSGLFAFCRDAWWEAVQLFQGLFLVGGNALLVALTSVSEKYVVRTVDQVPFVLETVHRMQMSSAWAPSHTCQLTHRNHIQSSSRAHPF